MGIRPLFVKRDEQIKGLTRLLLIALRVMTLIEIVVRAKLEKKNEKLDGLHPGQKKQERRQADGEEVIGGHRKVTR